MRIGVGSGKESRGSNKFVCPAAVNLTFGPVPGLAPTRLFRCQYYPRHITAFSLELFYHTTLATWRLVMRTAGNDAIH